MWLENENIVLRALEPEDIDVLYTWENDKTLWEHGGTLSPFSRLTLRQYLIDARQMDIYQSRQLRLMIDTNTETASTIGTVDLYEYDPYNKRAGVGILVDAAYREKDYATQSLALIEEYAFEFLDIHQLFAYIAVDNEKSYGLFLKAGYQLAGILKDWKKQKHGYKDVYLMQLIRNGKSERRNQKSHPSLD